MNQARFDEKHSTEWRYVSAVKVKDGKKINRLDDIKVGDNLDFSGGRREVVLTSLESQGLFDFTTVQAELSKGSYVYIRNYVATREMLETGRLRLSKECQWIPCGEDIFYHQNLIKEQQPREVAVAAE